MTGNATMTRRATGCLKKVAPEKKVFGHFLLLDGSIWMVLYEAPARDQTEADPFPLSMGRDGSVL